MQTYRRRAPAGRCLRSLSLISSFLTSTAGASPLSPELQKLQGAWVPQGAQCADVFFRQGKAINFRRPGATSREGVLIDGGRVGDGRQRCTISKLKPDGETYTILFTCFRPTLDLVETRRFAKI